MYRQQIIIVKDRENDPVIQSKASNKLRLNKCIGRFPVNEANVTLKLIRFNPDVNNVAFLRVSFNLSMKRDVKGS